MPVAARGLASEVLDLYGTGAFSFWQWNPATNQLSTHGSLAAESLEEWMLRIHPRDQAAFSEFLDRERSPAAPYLSIDYRIGRSRQGDWVHVRHTVGLLSCSEETLLSGLVEELSSPNLTRTLLERSESELRDGETRTHRFIDEALDLSFGGDVQPLLDLLRQILRADSIVLVELDARLAAVGSVSSGHESSDLPLHALHSPLVEALSEHRSPGLSSVIELELDADPRWFLVRPVLLADRRVAGALCVGFRSPHSRTEARRFRSLLSLAATFSASRLERDQEELQRRDLLSLLRRAQRLSGEGSLSGAFAGDLNHLLTLIEGHLHLLGEAFEAGDWEGWRESLGQIREASGQAADLSGRLLHATGREPSELCHGDLNRMVERFASMMRRVLDENIAIRLDLDPAIGLVRADEEKIRELLLALVLDTRDAMPQGGSISISTRPTVQMDGDEPHLFVRLRIADERETASLPIGEWTGSGAGPHPVASIVAEHGGCFESGGNGAVHILLPAESRPCEATGSALSAGGAAPHAATSLAGTTVLLVEDEAVVRRLARKLLEVLGCTVVEATSGREALDLWPEVRDRVSLVLTDVVMPETVSGWDLARELHHRHPGLAILVTSGHGSLPEEHGLGGIPHIGFLQKPYPMNVLKASLSKLAAVAAAGPVVRTARSR